LKDLATGRIKPKLHVKPDNPSEDLVVGLVVRTEGNSKPLPPDKIRWKLKTKNARCSNHYKYSEASNVDSCAIACASQPDCKGFSFGDNVENHCRISASGYKGGDSGNDASGYSGQTNSDASKQC
jgi:hypothetical protein